MLAPTVRGDHGETPGLPIHGRLARIDAVSATAILRQRMGWILLWLIASANLSRCWQTNHAWDMACGLGLGLGTCRWSFAIGTVRTPMLTQVPFQRGAGETEHRQREVFYKSGGPEIKLWRTRAPPSLSHKTADPFLSCRPLGRPLARSAVPDGRSIPELSTPRSAGPADQPRKTACSRTCLARSSFNQNNRKA